MAQCDICNKLGKGTIVKAANMSEAVQNGFNPFKAGLAPDMMAAVGMGSSYNQWRQDAIGGRLAISDWNICNNCMRHLKSYLPDRQQSITPQKNLFDNRVHCLNCGHENSPSRITCKTCRVKLPQPAKTSTVKPKHTISYYLFVLIPATLIFLVAFVVLSQFIQSVVTFGIAILAGVLYWGVAAFIFEKITGIELMDRSDLDNPSS